MKKKPQVEEAQIKQSNPILILQKKKLEIKITKNYQKLSKKTHQKKNHSKKKILQCWQQQLPTHVQRKVNKSNKI